MKVTYVTFLIGSLALAGVPPFSGFFSKDEIILAAKEADKLWLVVVLLVGAVLTAFYTTRMVLKTFFGDYRGHEHLHESPRSMTAPLVLLAVTTCFVGLLGFAPAGAPFLDWVYFGTEPHTAIFSPLVATLSIAAVVIGAISAWSMYRDYKQTDPITRLGGMYTLLEHKYYLDDIYWRGIVQPVRDNLSAGVYWFNQNVIDGFVNAVPAVTVGVFSKAVMWVDRNIIDALVNGFGLLMETFGRGLRHVQNGKVQWYAVGLFAGVIMVTLFVMK
jgi:NADH-quinone oxidoreductase subunit L